MAWNVHWMSAYSKHSALHSLYCTSAGMVVGRAPHHSWHPGWRRCHRRGRVGRGTATQQALSRRCRRGAAGLEEGGGATQPAGTAARQPAARRLPARRLGSRASAPGTRVPGAQEAPPLAPGAGTYIDRRLPVEFWPALSLHRPAVDCRNVRNTGERAGDATDVPAVPGPVARRGPHPSPGRIRIATAPRRH